VAELFADALAVIGSCAGLDDAGLVAAAALLGTIAGQDIDDVGNGPQLRQGVAPERVISTVDPDARHGHRCREDCYDGYKLHLADDADSDLLTVAMATTATTYDAEVLPQLLAADPVAVAAVLADTHYDSADTAVASSTRGIELVAPAATTSAAKGLFSKDAFHIDLEARTVTCPARHVVAIPPPAATVAHRCVRRALRGYPPPLISPSPPVAASSRAIPRRSSSLRPEPPAGLRLSAPATGPSPGVHRAALST
jgi:hypothetical protein